MFYKKATDRTYQIFKGILTNDKDLLVQAYKTYIGPIAECGTSLFCPYKKKDIQLVEKNPKIISPGKYLSGQGNSIILDYRMCLAGIEITIYIRFAPVGNILMSAWSLSCCLVLLKLMLPNSLVWSTLELEDGQ